MRLNSFEAKKLLAIAALSLLLGLVIIRWHSVKNVSFCIQVAGCQNQEPKGTVTTRTYGFPLAYKEVSSFRPNNNDENAANYAGYAETSNENLSFSVPSVLMNTVFWFGVLNLLAPLIKQRRPKATPMPPQPDPALPRA